MYSKEVLYILNKYNLKVIKPFRIADGGFKRSFVLLCQNPKEEKKVLKIFASKDLNAKEKFIREVQLLIFLRKNTQLRKFIPVVYKHNLNAAKGPLYYMLEYFDYKSFGEFNKDLGYQTGIFKRGTFEVFLDFWHTLSEECQEGLNWLHPYGLSRFMGELKFYQRSAPNILSSILWSKSLKYLEKRKTNIDNCVILSHLDLYPENLFVEKAFSPNFKVIDWEQTHLTAPGCNEAFLYLLFWKEDYFRKKIFSQVWEQGSDQTFKCFLLLFSIRFLYQTVSFADENNFSGSFKRFLLATINDIVGGKIDRPKNLQYLLSKNMIQKLLFNFYSLQDEIVCEDFPAGYGNTMIKIKTMTKSDEGKTFVLRVYSLNRLAENIRREAKIYRYLSKKGFPTYFIYKNRERRLVSKDKIYNKDRFFIITNFLVGNTIPRSKLRKQHVIQAGGWLAKMHFAGVIHNDYNRRNVLYDKEKISGIIDMEFSRFTTKPADHLRDLAKAISLWVQGIDASSSLTISEVYENFMLGYFGKSWRNESSRINKLIIEELRKLRSDYQKMNKISPSDYFKGIIKFINNIIPLFKKGFVDQV